MKRRSLLLGFGIIGATALSGGGTVYALNSLGLAPKVPAPETAGAQATPEKAREGSKPAENTHEAPKPAETPAGHEAAAAPHWSYEGATGPDHWSDLDTANAVCKAGGSQSPIDLANALRVPALPGLQISYAATRVKVTNNGHTFQVNVDKGSSLTIDGKRYDLLQFHFHTPSEHTIDGKAYPLELHLVHQAADKSLAVIGVMFAEGNPNTTLARFWDRMPRAQSELDAGVSIELKDLLPRAMDDYFTYSGSLTTPPCSESVRWIVVKQPLQLSKAQITTFRSVFPMNARPIMPLGARYVLSS
jgi:carbonic anhydrase